MFAIRRITAYFILVVLASCGGPVDSTTVPQAEPAESTSADIGDHIVHFSAQSTDQLPPDVASAYNIVRSKNRAMLNVSIIEKATGTPVTAEVTVKTQNLTGQLKNVSMREIPELEAIYYIGETAVANRETLIFDITIIPDGKTIPSEIRFKRQFYTD